MSMFDYLLSRELSKDDPSFAALIMAAMRKADDENITKLRICWPEIFKELHARYNAPGGYLPGELAGTMAEVIVVDEIDKDPDEPARNYNEDEHER